MPHKKLAPKWTSDAHRSHVMTIGKNTAQRIVRQGNVNPLYAAFGRVGQTGLPDMRYKSNYSKWQSSRFFD
ncbi:UNKNOWN [Stylonychia lemnae]|uniref:Uncharacterized protein n=1 Tax=Stylonychia lemnae TaxID=5949 RepID=A0A078A4X7_STYLE|nr:UNKNOWN [Stylonychia lemnae]|eukprot:CDW77249.1 UNKNOWN [Stylonychia lemnae]